MYVLLLSHATLSGQEIIVLSAPILTIVLLNYLSTAETINQAYSETSLYLLRPCCVHMHVC